MAGRGRGATALATTVRRGLRCLALGVLCAPGCASSLRVMTGRVDQAPLSVTARATIGQEAVRLALSFDNGTDDPIAVDLDRLKIRTASGAVVRVVGRQQVVTGALRGELQRVPYDSVVIEPRGRAQAEVDLPTLPEHEPLVLQLPTLYRLGIDGQRPLPSIQIPLQQDEAAGRLATQEFDPFEE